MLIEYVGLFLIANIYLITGQNVNVDGNVNTTETERNEDYLVDCIIAIQNISQNELEVLSTELAKVFCFTIERSQLRRLEGERRGGLGFRPDGVANDSDCYVQIIETQVNQDHILASFTLTYKETLVKARVAVEEISQFTLSHLSALTGLPIVAIKPSFPDEYVVPWWIVWTIIGCALIIGLVGWMCMFVYYNTCASPMVVRKSSGNTGDVENLPKNDYIEQNYTEERPKDIPPLDLPASKIEEENPFQDSIFDVNSNDFAFKPEKPNSPSVVPLFGSNDPIEKVEVVEVVEPKETKDSDVKVEVVVKESPIEDPHINEKEVITKSSSAKLPERWSPYYPAEFIEQLRAMEPNRYSGSLSRHPQPSVHTDLDDIDVV